MIAALYITRHGESTWNAAHLIQGQTDVPLSERGRAQAARLAARLRHEPIDIVFTSDLARARDTATCVVEALRVARVNAAGGRPEDVSLHVLPALRERRYGSWEGRPAAEVRGAGLALVASRAPAGAPAAGSSNWWKGPPDAESFAACVTRQLGAWAEMEAHLTGGAHVLLVGHGAAIRALMCGLTNTPSEEQGRWQLGNTGISRLSWYDGTLSTDYWNDCTHIG
ncbi:MAG: histidine phosphatase family protein [Chloroflexi bacterium]|nr:histidine phosphatase family protein [Chloroflexota bacterium]